MFDRYGLPVSCSSQAAADAYVAAVDNLLSAGADLAAGFQDVLRIDPQFALARIGLARCLATFGDAARAREQAELARAAARGTSRREQQHVEALALAIEGRSAQALAAIRAHVAEFPRDAMVIAPATGTFGLIAFSTVPDYERQWLALMDELAPHLRGDWWFETLHAFARCEAGQPDLAYDQIGRALELAPHNANGAHVMAHVCYERVQPEQGAAFLRRWLAEHPKRVLLRGHLSWHLALYELALGNAPQAWALFEREIVPPLFDESLATPPLNLLTDVVAWLWRAELAQGARGHDARWEQVSAWASQRFPAAGGNLADLHCTLAHLRAANRPALTALLDALQGLAAERPASAAVLRCGRAFVALSQGDADGAARLLAAANEGIGRIGGSRAQRDIVARTELSAWRLAGALPDAQTKTQTQAQALVARRPTLAMGI